MILGRDLLAALDLYLKFSENVIIVGAEPYEGCLAPMIDIIYYEFKSLTYEMIKTK